MRSASSSCLATSCTPLAGASFSLGLDASLALAVVPPGAFAFLAAALFFFESLTCEGNAMLSVYTEIGFEKKLCPRRGKWSLSSHRLSKNC